MIDDGEGYVTMLGEGQHKARKQHRCAECARHIEPGETYLRERFVFDGKMSDHKTCSHCIVVRSWLQGECGGFLFGAVEEDIREHAYDGYDSDVIRLAVGMKWKWTTPNGKRLPVPAVPPTTHDKMRAAA
ncbi:MAG: hypothetical protein EOP02_10365 [Proteobacteria bacterium]|nr:MAG: hypothetical protein EOP02_10365 [Pseudomonadota bacterium]